MPYSWEWPGFASPEEPEVLLPIGGESEAFCRGLPSCFRPTPHCFGKSWRAHFSAFPGFYVQTCFFFFFSSRIWFCFSLFLLSFHLLFNILLLMAAVSPSLCFMGPVCCWQHPSAISESDTKDSVCDVYRLGVCCDLAHLPLVTAILGTIFL